MGGDMMGTDMAVSGIKVCVLGLRGLPDVMGGVEMHCEQLFPLLKERRPNDSFTVIGRKAYLAGRSSEYCGLKIITLPHARGKYLEAISNTAYGGGIRMDHASVRFCSTSMVSALH
jgi:hypothetical protein